MSSDTPQRIEPLRLKSPLSTEALYLTKLGDLGWLPLLHDRVDQDIFLADLYEAVLMPGGTHIHDAAAEEVGKWHRRFYEGRLL